jgi:hypothetical protein
MTKTSADLAWDGAQKSRASGLRYQRRILFWRTLDGALRLLAIAGAFGAYLSAVKSYRIDGASPVAHFALASVVFGIIGLSMGVPSRVRAHGVRLARYRELQHTFSRLAHSNVPEQEVLEALKRFRDLEKDDAL